MQLVSARIGFSLVELLVVVAVIGVLVALLLPAVQAARESARALSCRNNLRQIALALHNFENGKRHYPPSFEITPGTVLATNNGSWSIHGRLLPYLEQTAAYARVRLDLAWDAAENRASGVPTMRIPVYQCPSEVYSFVRVGADGLPLVHPQNYGFNFGTWLVFDPSTGEGGDGAFFVNSRLRTGDFVDGLSNTLCAVDVKTFTPYLRNTADPGPIPPATVEFARGVSGQEKLGPETNDNTGHTEWPDGRVHHSGITTVFPPNTVVPYAKGELVFDIDYNSVQEGRSAVQPTYAAITARSYHRGIVNAAFMDGSVRGIAEAIDTRAWRAWGTRAGEDSLFERE